MLKYRPIMTRIGSPCGDGVHVRERHFYVDVLCHQLIYIKKQSLLKNSKNNVSDKCPIITNTLPNNVVARLRLNNRCKSRHKILQRSMFYSYRNNRALP